MNVRGMNLILWILQWLMSAAFIAAGGMKLFRSKAQIAEKMDWAQDFSETQIKLIGAAEVLGAIALVVPRLTGTAPILTPIAAGCLAILMVGATAVHLRRREPPIPAAGLAFLCILIALGRTLIKP